MLLINRRRSGKRHHGVAVFCAASLAISISGCPQQGQEKTPPATAPSATAPAAAQAGPSASRAPQAAPATAAPGTDQQGPPYLPANLPVEGWTRREPIRTAQAADLGKLLPPSQAVWFDHFHLKSAASTTYAWNGEGRELLARVVVFEAQSPEDAYGLMSCQSGSSELLNVGGETRVETGVELHFHCWQGDAYAHLWTDATDEKAALQTRRLLMHVVGRIPRTDMPGLVEAMPREHLKPGARWLVRNLAGLPSASFAHPAGLDLDEVAKVLGMSGETLMCIASYDVPEVRKANTVWVVRYPSQQAADEAYARYSRRLEEAMSGSPWQSTSLLPPHSVFLIGTWTAEEESLQYMLPRIEELLPS
ncbi:MAG TPA: DUF6599 family protein [Phycisphaerae bacterium]|nr:DUF6599 family protein [Phycisphaerae bacterium]